MIGGSTRVFALLGHPVRHSLSPAMHNAAFRALGLDAVYVALDCAEASVAPLMRALAEAGGGGNVTVPHKRAAAGLAAPAACNTFWGEGGVLHAANTDPEGILHALRRLGLHPQTWLVIGTGGSARGCLAAARRLGAAVSVRSRSAERARALEAEAAAAGVRVADDAGFDLVVNATPLGLQPSDPAPASLAGLAPACAVLDLVYLPGETPWVRAARAAGHPAADGREVLLGQGAAAFRHWYPELEPPVEVMRAAIRAGLG